MGTFCAAKTGRPLLRVIHHLSSSGGTVISKCLAAMPDTVLLSEVHPITSHRVPFFPIDPLGQLIWNYPELTPATDVLHEQFRTRLQPVVDQCISAGKTLVLRDHSHSDYLSNSEPVGQLVAALKPNFRLMRAVTIRDPIDAWLSMTESKFNEQLSGFDDYCRRVLRFVADHEGLRFWRYEDFAVKPVKVMAEICEHLHVRFDAAFEDRFNDFVLTGDSGRKPRSIGKLPRRGMPAGFLEMALSLCEYRAIAERFGYDLSGCRP